MGEGFILEVLKVLFPYGIGAVGTGTALAIAFAVLLVFFPEKIEKWQSLLWGWIENLGLLYKRASKQKIQHSIQSRVTTFAKRLGHSLPEFDPPDVRIEWVDETVDRKAFLDGGRAIIRLRRNDPNNENVATACMVYVSNILLRKTGRYLSPTQKDSVELYVGYKMLQGLGEEAMDAFIDRWLYPGIEESNQKVSEYFDRYRTIDNAEFFVPVFLQELIYLGEKVFGRSRDDALIHEVDGALEFLEIYESRRIGEKVARPYFNGSGCRFGIMIVGVQPNIEDERHDVYLRHIRETLFPADVDTIYMIGPKQNHKFMKEIAREISEDFIVPFSRDYKASLLNSEGDRIPVSNHLLVVRRKTRERYIG